jgi:hypothetical protein
MCIRAEGDSNSLDSRESLTLNPPANTDIAPNFDRLARPYRWLEYLTFGPFLWRCRVHFLPQLFDHTPALDTALILGDGDGRFTARLLRANPRVQVHAVDISPQMLHSLQREAGPHVHRLTVEVADLRHWRPNPKTQHNLIATHFFLDCLTTPEVADLAKRLIPVAAPGALWLVSEFAIPPTRFGRITAAPLVAFLYRSFRLLTNLRLQSLPDHSQALTASGWSLQSKRVHLRGLLVSELWSVKSDATQGERISS